MKFIADFVVNDIEDKEMKYTIYRSENQSGRINKYLVMDKRLSDRYLFDTSDDKIINKYPDRAFDTYNEAKFFILYNSERKKNEELKERLKQLSA